MLRKIFESTMENLPGSWRRLQEEQRHDLLKVKVTP